MTKTTMPHWLFTLALAIALSCGLVPAGAVAAVPEFKLEKTPAWVTTVSYDSNLPLGPDKQTDGAAYLLVDRQVLLKGDRRESFNHFAYKIQNETGLENFANVEIRFDPSYQKLLIHSVDVRRGELVMHKLTQAAVKVLQREKSLEKLVFDGSKTANLFLEDVRVGDVIEYSFTLVGSNPVFAGYQSGQFDLQWDTPVQVLHARLLTDTSHPVMVKSLRTQVQAESRQLGMLREQVWRLNDLTAIRFRNDVPEWFDSQPEIQWSDFPDWGAVVSWALPIYRTPAALPNELAQEARRIQRQYTTPGERAVEALRYVQKAIRYLGVEVGPGSHAPNQPAEVLARRYGDCKDKSLLLLTLLGDLGIEAYPALVNTKIGRGVLDQQASPYAFNHVLVQAKIDGEVFWLDPTRQPQMGSITDIYQGDYGYALVVQRGQVALTEMKPGSASTAIRRVVAVYDASEGVDKPVRLTVTTTLDGRSAEQMRARVGNVSTDSLQKQLANYFAKTYSGLAIERPYSLTDNIDTNQIVLTEYYAIPDLWKKLGDDRVEAYFAAPDVLDYIRNPQNTFREEPLGLFHPVDVMQTTYILVPEKWKLKGGTTRVQDPSFSFLSKAVVAAGLITEVDSYRSLKDSVESKDMQAYLANLRKARDVIGFTIRRSTKQDAKDD